MIQWAKNIPSYQDHTPSLRDSEGGQRQQRTWLAYDKKSGAFSWGELPCSRVLTEDDVTALIITYRRSALLRASLDGLLAGTVVPSRILVSEGSGDQNARNQIVAMMQDYPIRLLPTPILGTITGNRNYLIRSCDTELALLMDDDIRIHPSFLERALDLINNGAGDIVTAFYSFANHEAWFTVRGHWRRRLADEPQAASLSTLLAPTELLREIPQDENLIYGYEEADFSLRLSPRTAVSLLECPTEDLSNRTTIGLSSVEKRQRADSARVFVSMKRYWGNHKMMARFFVIEVTANVMRRRRPLPKAVVARQWRTVAIKLLQAAPWPWNELS